MKFKFLSLLLLSASLFMVSCGDDDPMEPEVCDVLEETLIGTWNVEGTGQTGQITFNDDGTYVDDNGVILEYSNNDIEATIKTWELADSELSMRVAIDPDLGSGFAATTFTVTSFDCNTINVSIPDFIDFKFTK